MSYLMYVCFLTVISNVSNCNNFSRYPLKAVKVMHTVALRTESSLSTSTTPPSQTIPYKASIGYDNKP